uniref:Uncharacterized protein n=1 Tax=Rhizophora mucronata TaxID=61149 RepID=A0A2P2NP47_RHIMU
MEMEGNSERKQNYDFFAFPVKMLISPFRLQCSFNGETFMQ